MSKIYSWRFHVRSYDLDATGRVSPGAFLRFLEEGAIQASASNGYDLQWYETNKRIWVIRKMTARFYNVPTGYGDELELKTWVSDFRRVQSNREYELLNADGERILRARGNWAFLNSETMQLERVATEMIENFQPDSDVEAIDTLIPDGTVIGDPVLHTTERRVQRHELDTAGHVNNTNYLVWAEQALINSLRAIGWPPERFTNDEFTMLPYAIEIDYHRSALDDEPIWIVTRLAEVGYDRAAWHQEIRHGATNELIAKARLVRVFSDINGPRSIPDAMQLALIQRQRS